MSVFGESKVFNSNPATMNFGHFSPKYWLSEDTFTACNIVCVFISKKMDLTGLHITFSTRRQYSTLYFDRWMCIRAERQACDRWDLYLVFIMFRCENPISQVAKLKRSALSVSPLHVSDIRLPDLLLATSVKEYPQQYPSWIACTYARKSYKPKVT